jgi:D-alanine-D-alanine ligase
MATVGVIFGGRSVEHRVSVVSARTVAEGLRQAGHEVVPLGIAEDGCWVAPDVAQRALDGRLDELGAVGGRIRDTISQALNARIEVVFPIVHGTWGEDGTLQGLLEMLDLPYVGAGVTASAVSMDKLLSRRLLTAAGLACVDYEAISRAEWLARPEAAVQRCRRIEPPWFVKPSVGGSSVGVRRVTSEDRLAGAIEFALDFDDTILVERAIKGRELECAVLGDQRLEASVVGEIVPGNEFYDYADKYLQDLAELIAPAQLDEAVSTRIRRSATDAFHAVGGWGMARVDFLLEGESDVFINEINTLPGFTSISMYPRLWSLSGLPLSRLVERLVEIALARHERRRSSPA